MQQVLEKPKKISKKEKREILEAKNRWRIVRENNKKGIQGLKSSKSLDPPIIYTVLGFIALSMVLYFFKLYVESLVAFMFSSFLGSLNAWVNRNKKAAVPFTIALVVSLLLIGGVIIFK